MALTLRRSRSDLPAEAGESRPSLADEVLDEILPEEIDWRQIVWSYPKSTLALAALGGFLLGRSHGRRLLNAASHQVGETVTDGFNEFFGRKVL
ncbi:MAG: hypothetical protein ACE5GX_17190 [Thermoanaerobaculia bacterium]